MKKAFTIVELLVVIAVISIIACVTIPAVMNGYNTSKQQIVDDFNSKHIKVIDYDTDEVLYEGDETFDTTGYTMVNVDYQDGIVIMYLTKQKE